MKKATIAIIAVAVFAVGAIFVVGQKAGFGNRHGRMSFAFKALGLTEEQQTQVKQITETSREKMKPVFEAMKANREKLKEATKGGAFDEAAITAIAKEQGDLSAQMIVERERTKSQIFALLTDEQKAKFAELKDKRMDGFRGGRKGHRGPHGGDEFGAKAEKPTDE